MKRLYFDRFISTALLFLWMSMIFMFSAQTGETSGDTSGSLVDVIIKLFYPNFDRFSPAEQLNIIELWQIIVRKTAHFTEYAILGILCANAFRTYKFSLGIHWSVSTVICILYAVSDEIHQYFVPDRAGRFLDVCIDTAGSITGIAFFMILYVFIQKRRKNR